MLHKAEISEIVWLEYRITCLFYSKLLKYSSRYKYLPSHPQSIFSFSHIVLFNNFYVSYIREIKYQVYRRLTCRVLLYSFFAISFISINHLCDLPWSYRNILYLHVAISSISLILMPTLINRCVQVSMTNYIY